MITNLLPYPAYKSSGVEWLGDVPGHWEVVQLGRIGRFSKGSGGTKADEVPEGVPCIRYGDLYTSHKYHIGASRAFVTETDALNYTPIRYGDILFAGSGETIEEIGKSAVNLIEQPACCGGDVILFRPERESDAKFSGYAIDCPQSQYQKSTMGRGITVMHIYGGELKNLWMALPPLPEQRAIARYLDHVDRRIQRYIEAKEKLITLLQEARQATIQRAVTRGLDPSVPLKPSGVDWLGDVPAHWEVRRLKWVSDLNPSRAEARAYLNEDTPVSFLPMEKVGTEGQIDARESVPASSVRNGFTYFRRGDVLVAKITPCFENGKGAYLGCLPTEIGFGSTEYHVLRAKSAVLPQFLYLLTALFAFRQKGTHKGEGTHKGSGADAMTGAAGQKRVPTDFVANYLVPVPPLPEQSAIFAYLDRATADIDAAIDIARRQVELMTEYRASLIAHVVTGKLDVRAAAA